MHYRKIVQFSDIFTRGSISEEENSVSTIFEEFELSRKWDGPKVCTLVHLLPPVTPWRWPKSKKYGKCPISQICQTCESLGLISTAIFGKNRLTFCPFWAILGRKPGGITRGGQISVYAPDFSRTQFYLRTWSGTHKNGCSKPNYASNWDTTGNSYYLFI